MTQDTRKDPRAKIVSLNVRYKSATVDEFIENHSHDVSKGGVFIKTPNAFPPGTLLKFEIRIAGDKAVIVGVGRVVWKRETTQTGVERPSGMGVKFIKIDDASRALIDKLVATKADAGRAYEIEQPADEPGALDAGHTTARGIGAAAPAAAASSPGDRKHTVMGMGVGNIAGFDAGAAPSATNTTPTSAPPPAETATSAFDEDLPAAVAKPTGSSKFGPLPGHAARTEPAKRSMKSTLVGVAPDLSGVAPPVADPAKKEPAKVDPPKPAPAKPVATGMFAMSEGQPSAPIKEPTVMKQAAELLEEALKEAGGSMEDIGNNPLFSAPGADKIGRTPEPAPLPKPARNEDSRASAKLPLRDPASASAIAKSVRGSDPGPAPTPAPAKTTSDRPPPAEKERPSSRPPRAVEESPRKSERPPARVRAISQPPPKKSKSGVLIGGALLVAAAGLAVVYKSNLVSGSGAPVLPPVPSSLVPSASASASAPSTTVATTKVDTPVAPSAAPSAASAPEPSASAAKPAASASAAPPAVSAKAPPPPPVEKPAPAVEKPAPPPVAKPAPAPKPPAEKPAPSPKPKPPADDSDNPY